MEDSLEVASDTGGTCSSKWRHTRTDIVCALRPSNRRYHASEHARAPELISV